MISDGFEWSWFPVKPFEIHEIFMRIIKIMYRTISSQTMYVEIGQKINQLLGYKIWKLKQNYYSCHRNQYFVWLDRYRCLLVDDFRSIINNFRLFFYIFDSSCTHWQIGITLRYVYADNNYRIIIHLQCGNKRIHISE